MKTQTIVLSLLRFSLSYQCTKLAQISTYSLKNKNERDHAIKMEVVMHFSLQIINMNKQVHKQKKMMKWNLFSRLVLEHCIKLILPLIHTTCLKQMYLALIYVQIHPFQRQLIWISGSNRSCRDNSVPLNVRPSK